MVAPGEAMLCSAAYTYQIIFHTKGFLLVIKHNPVFIAEGLLGDPMKLFCRHRAVIVHFTVYVFCLSGQFKPGKIRGKFR